MFTNWKIKTWNWFRNSGTLVWARLQYIVGAVVAGLIATFSNYDWTQLASFDAKTAFKMLLLSVVSGVVTEFVRRSGTRVEATTVVNEHTDYKPVEVLTLERVVPVPPPPAG